MTIEITATIRTAILDRAAERGTKLGRAGVASAACRCAWEVDSRIARGADLFDLVELRREYEREHDRALRSAYGDFLLADALA